jgi:dissimilatory sulfite reductase (desulfoviridin) alpha/beta subunit
VPQKSSGATASNQKGGGIQSAVMVGGNAVQRRTLSIMVEALVQWGTEPNDASDIVKNISRQWDERAHPEARRSVNQRQSRLFREGGRA